MRIFVDYHERLENNHKPGTMEYVARNLQLAFGGNYKVTRYPQPKGNLDPTDLLAEFTIDYAQFSIRHRHWDYHRMWQKFIRSN